MAEQNLDQVNNDQQPSKNKWWLILLGVIVILAAIWLVANNWPAAKNTQSNNLNNSNNVNSNNPIINANANVNQPIEVSLTINDGQNNYKYNESLPAQSTVLDLMKAASAKENFSFNYKDSSAGAFVEEIMGLTNDQAKNLYWLYSVNGQEAAVGVSALVLKAGDKVQWNYKGFTLN